MSQRNMLIQIIFRSNRLPAFTRMTAFPVNCKPLSRNISRWCSDVITLVTRSIPGLIFFLVGCVGEAGWNTELMAQLRCRWLTTDPWSHCVSQRNCGLLMHGGPSEAGDCSHPPPMTHRVMIAAALALQQWSLAVPMALRCPKTYSHECWYRPWRDRRIFHRPSSAPRPGPWLTKIYNSVDNNLLPKIRFHEKSVTFSVDINRTCWPKRKLNN